MDRVGGGAGPLCRRRRHRDGIHGPGGFTDELRHHPSVQARNQGAVPGHAARHRDRLL